MRTPGTLRIRTLAGAIVELGAGSQITFRETPLSLLIGIGSIPHSSLEMEATQSVLFSRNMFRFHCCESPRSEVYHAFPA